MNLEADEATLRFRLEEMRIEHRDLDEVIGRMEEALYKDQLQLRRLKKRKLRLKEQITRLEDDLIPDTLA